MSLSTPNRSTKRKKTSSEMRMAMLGSVTFTDSVNHITAKIIAIVAEMLMVKM